jgi:hypothetical protein
MAEILLPAGWVSGLSEGKKFKSRPKAKLNSAEVNEWLAGRPDGEMCVCLQGQVAKATAWFAEHGRDGAYPHAGRVIWGLVRDARDGHPGAQSALAAVKAAYLHETDSRGRDNEGEWTRSLNDAIKKVAAEPVESEAEDPCALYKAWRPTQSSDAPSASPRFAWVSAVELAKPVPPMRWLVKKVWPEKSHGPLAGVRKSLKSWNALALALAITSGEPYLSKFDVHQTGPVLYFNGEGGAVPFARRAQRLSEAYGLDLRKQELYVTTGVGSVSGAEFRDALQAKIQEVQPVLVILDPLYVYHPENIEAQNLYERGRMLGQLSAVVGHETALVVVDHYRKNGGATLDLDEIGQSGVAQWADSWILQGHREPVDLETGKFRLSTEFGSRQWGGARWAIDWDCPFDPETNEPGEVAWTVEPFEGSTSARAPKMWDNHVEAEIVRFIDAEPYEHTKGSAEAVLYADLKDRGVSRAQYRDAWTRLESEGAIRAEKRRGRDGKERSRYAAQASGLVKISGEVPGEVDSSSPSSSPRSTSARSKMAS